MPRNKTSNKYLIATSNVLPSQLQALEEWIADDCFRQYELPEFLLSGSKNRPHNRLYKFTLPVVDYQVVMKVTHIHQEYNQMRRWRALLKHYRQQDANYRAFQCCRYAYCNNLAAPKPLAYWQKRDSFAQVKSYFLYQYIEDGMPWLEASDKLRETRGSEWHKHKDLLKRKIVDAVKCLHNADIRHGDMVAHNILISISDTELSQAKVCFIDYDRSTFAGLKKPAFLKRFFDLRDLRKLYIDDASPYDLLDIYLGNGYHPLWNVALAFWQLGKLKRSNKRV